MPSPDVLLIVTCATLALTAWGGAAAFRSHLSQDARAARAFLLPIAVLLPALVAALAFGTILAAAPLASAIAMCGAAARLLQPTASSRFARFERQFWAHVRQTERDDRLPASR